MGFRLAPKSVTLNDYERNDGHVVCVISQNSLAFGTYYVKWSKIYRYILRVKCSSTNLVFNDVSLMAIFAGQTRRLSPRTFSPLTIPPIFQT